MTYTRRQFLTSTVGLAAAPYLPSPLYAQAKPPNNIVFSDFESGTYDGWTLIGNCWTPEPYSDQYFPGKITGFQGKRFLCTLHPKVGSAATGKAISREFTIEKPFINFLIGGGNHPGEACLNLLVDGKIVRTTTGNDSAGMLQTSWDVCSLIGKKAHLELLDSSNSPQRGYIMVDAIEFSKTEKPLPVRIRAGFTLKLLQYSPIWKGIDARLGASPFDFGMGEMRIQRAIDASVRAMHAPDMQIAALGTKSVTGIAHAIQSRLEVATKNLDLAGSKPLAQDWLLAEAVCEWARVNMYYDHEWDQELSRIGGWDKAGSDEITARTTSTPILARNPPTAVCWGIAVTVRDIARATGLKCDFVNGTVRWIGSPPPSRTNHGIVCFVFTDNLVVPANVSSVLPQNVTARHRLLPHKTESHQVLPRHPEAWELHVATFNSDIGRGGKISGDWQSVYRLLNMSYEDWVSLNTQTYRPLWDSYTRWDETRTPS